MREEAAYVGICLVILEGTDVKRIVKASGLSRTTVYRLRSGVRPGTHAMTVRKLGKAAGINLVYENGQPRLRVVGGKAKVRA